MVRQARQLLVFVLLLLLIISCKESPEEKFKAMEKSELASGVRYDSLFEGFYFKMKMKDFRDYCFNMNLKGEFKQGGVKNETWVIYNLKNEMKYPAIINFYPNFQGNEITEMQASIYYDHPNYKNHTFVIDSLMQDVLHLMESWYGPGFIRIKSPVFYKDDVFAKVDGNRRITVYKDQGGEMINVWFVDLLAQHENRLSEEKDKF